MKNRQIVFTDINKAELIDAEYVKPSASEVTVKLSYSAISCGTEKANLSGNLNISPSAPAAKAAVFPRYAGYSSTGTVCEVGEGVDNVNVGDKVALYWSLHKEYNTISCKNVVKLPEGTDMAEAAFVHIGTFPLAAVRKTKLELGESALVMGLGILGLFAVQFCKAAGGYPVIAADPVSERRELALELGADYALDPTEKGFADRVHELTDGGANAAIEVTGLGIGFDQALDCMAKFGRVALLGCTRDSNFTIDYYRKIHFPGINVIGAHTNARPTDESSPNYWTTADDMKAILRLMKGKRIDISKLIKEIHSPIDAPQVYARLAADRNFPVGVVFDWSRLE